LHKHLINPYPRHLEAHPNVAWVSYLGLPSHDSHQLAQSLLRKDAYGGVLSFGVKGDDKTARKVIDGLKLASNVAMYEHRTHHWPLMCHRGFPNLRSL
jgi:O-acetylhomoserine/O-acetylserine sulfhydrylase-like pyridoxal-dependent enzyme